MVPKTAVPLLPLLGSALQVLIESDEAAVAASTSIDVQRQIPSAM